MRRLTTAVLLTYLDSDCAGGTGEMGTMIPEGSLMKGLFLCGIAENSGPKPSYYLEKGCGVAVFPSFIRIPGIKNIQQFRTI